jgi:Glycosyl transferases group 1
MSKRVAIAEWISGDQTANEICSELTSLGYQPEPFLAGDAVPKGSDIVFTYGPFGPWLQIPQQIAAMPKVKRPTLVHYSYENPPDPRIPWPLVWAVGTFRSWIGRLSASESDAARAFARNIPSLWGKRSLARFRYVGDYCYAYRQGGADLYVSYSQIYARLFAWHGLPAIFVPWGTAPDQHADLNLERDIDVLWLGIQRNHRRRRTIRLVREGLEACGKHLYCADGQENPMIFHEARTRLLNRTKIVLNVEHVPFGDALIPRFHLAAGNRCLVVSEPEPPHYPAIVAGKHYVAVQRENLVDTILYYLEHEDERRQIAENAYRLVTTDLTFHNTIKGTMEAVEQIRQTRDDRATYAA